MNAEAITTDKLFLEKVGEGIPSELPSPQPWDPSVSHAPVRRDLLSTDEKKLALSNALRYFPQAWHAELAPEFADELRRFGRIYMHRFRPGYAMYARPIESYPARCAQAAAIMLMIQNNLDPRVAQHPHELITYGGNGSVFQHWAQYLLTMQYLSVMEEDQTLVMYSGHPLGLFPSHRDAPRVVVTNGLMIPNYSRQEDWERFNAMGVTQFGQMTAGSYMYIGPQGIVHGTTITVMNAARMMRVSRQLPDDYLPLFVTSGLGGMSGAQPKAGNIAGVISVTAEVNPLAAWKRHGQGWVDEVFEDATALCTRIRKARQQREVVSLAFLGNIVALWELLYREEIYPDLGSDQTSLHNPWSGGYYPASISFEEAGVMMTEAPAQFRSCVQASLVRHAEAIARHVEKGMYFFDYGNAFLLEAGRAGAPVWSKGFSAGAAGEGRGREYIYPSYVQDILGPLCFDYGFGPFRWVCCSGSERDLARTDAIAREVLVALAVSAPREIRQQLDDNIKWIEEAASNKLVVGSQARILYADAEGRIAVAKAFNDAIARGEIGPIVLGRDHHDVSGTDSPFRETSNIYDGSRFTADMAVQNFAGDAFRGATWVSLHNGGGVGWGEVVNGGFGMLLDGSADSERRLKSMLHWDVNNGIARRAWARNREAVFAAQRAMEQEPKLRVTLAHEVAPELLEGLFS
jgi:urocanate hydratase